jgi:hypothetical protein
VEPIGFPVAQRLAHLYGPHPLEGPAPSLKSAPIGGRQAVTQPSLIT